MFAGQVKIVSHSSCRTSAILKYICPQDRKVAHIKDFNRLKQSQLARLCRIYDHLSLIMEASSLNFIGLKYINVPVTILPLSLHIGMFLLHISLNMILLHAIVTVNPFMPDEISHPFMPDKISHPIQLDESILNLRVVG